MTKKLFIFNISVFLLFALLSSCVAPLQGRLKENGVMPANYNNQKSDTVNSAMLNWREFFTDPFLRNLIDTALKNNQELNIVNEEINILRNETLLAKGQYLPFVGLHAGSGLEKSARYTRHGALEANTPITPGKKFPEPLPDFFIAANASWEIDIWNKLRNSKKSAVNKYLASVEGKKFLVTNLVSEIANAYYELMALDRQLVILDQNIAIQQNALQIVKLEKESAKVTELAVKKFEAELLKNQSSRNFLLQQITETENTLNFLTARYPQKVERNIQSINDVIPTIVQQGVPSQLLSNRADIMRAEKELAVAKLDVKVAKAGFYPSLVANAALGYQAYNAAFLLQSPVSVLYTLAGDMVAPLINRKAIKANYYSAGSKQIQAVHNYERTVLKAYIEVANQLSNITNISNSYDLKAGQVEALTASIEISTGLFKSARADYMEVLMTQRDALEAKFELVETKMLRMKAQVALYKALGGGWR